MIGASPPGMNVICGSSSSGLPPVIRNWPPPKLIGGCGVPSETWSPGSSSLSLSCRVKGRGCSGLSVVAVSMMRGFC